VQRREQERAARKKEKRIRRRERREQRSEEFRLRELQGLSSPATSDYSSSDEEEEESDGGGASSPREVGACAPLTQGCRGGRRDSAWGGRRSVRHQAAYERGDVRHGGDWGCGGGHVVHGHNACRAPEEEEARLLYPEVSDRFPRCRIFEERGLDFLAFVFEGWRSPCPPSRLQRC
jgi:hypothetical protein